MRFITADKIHNGKTWMPEKTVLEVTPGGVIQDIHDAANIPPEQVTFFNGIICPGFVNVHCHLELSHLKGQAEEGTGLVPFLKTVIGLRNHFSREEKQIALSAALAELKRNGTVALGDIANTTDTLYLRHHPQLHVHTFIEVLGFTEDHAAEQFAFYEKIYRTFSENSDPNGSFILRQSVVPHAPYSVSEKMFALIDTFDEKSLLSIHNQECQAENELYQTKTGAFLDFHEYLSIDNAFFTASGTTSLKTWLPCLSATHPLLLIHNTFMAEEDILFLKKEGRKFFLGLCPQANWYIERKLPPVDLFEQHDLQICLGTDSLSSNHELSIWGEMRCLKRHFPHLPLEKLIRWGTWNGALALQMEESVGSIDIGKRPGLVLLPEEDAEQVTVII